MKKIVSNLPLMLNSLLVVKDDEEIKIDGLNTSPDLDQVLSNQEVQKELNKRFIVTFVDMNENYKLADEYKILGTPTEVFLDYEGNEIDRIQGYEREDKFMNKLKEI